MAYTLADYARVAADNKLKSGVIDIIRVTSPLLDAMSFETTGALSVELNRTKTLPTVYSRKIGGTFTASKGVTEPLTERMFNFGGYVDIDKVLIKAKAIVDQRTLQTTMFTKAMTLFFHNAFINGTPSADYDSLIGLWWRLVNDMPASQSISAASIDISPDSAALAAAQLSLLQYIDQLCEVVGSPGMPDFLFMNATTKRRLSAAIKAQGLLKTTEDAFGRTFETYGPGGPKIVDMGVTDPLDLTTTIITDVELANGTALTGATFTSIYAVKLGGEYLNGWDEYPLDVNDIGLMEDGLTYRIMLDWTPGIYMTSPFSIGRIYGIQAA